ncbi:hypothetical protein DY245_26595, partial [Streptomyces inhibens]
MRLRRHRSTRRRTDRLSHAARLALPLHPDQADARALAHPGTSSASLPARATAAGPRAPADAVPDAVPAATSASAPAHVAATRA